jgi:hypothetical protein
MRKIVDIASSLAYTRVNNVYMIKYVGCLGYRLKPGEMQCGMHFNGSERYISQGGDETVHRRDT